jgi:hypothetical protein
MPFQKASPFASANHETESKRCVVLKVRWNALLGRSMFGTRRDLIDAVG